MSDLLNSYTFEAKRIASDFEHCQHYEEVERCEGFEYKVGKLLESTDEKACKSIRAREGN